MPATVTVNEATFPEAVVASEQPVVVDFWAEWCGPCKMIAPILDEIAAENDNVTVAKLNVDENPTLARQYGVMSIPTLIVFKDGQPDSTIVGARSKAQLLEDLSSYLS